jgi:hypothetical protein
VALDLRARAGVAPRPGRLSAWHAVFGLPFAGFGLVAMLLGIGQLRGGSTRLGVLALGFGAVFAAVGVGLIWAVRWGLRDQREADTRRRLHPAEPWRWSGRWDEPRLRSAGGAAVAALWVFALLWSAIAAVPVWMLLPEALAAGRWGTVAGMLVFPAAGILLAAHAVRATLRQRRFGVSVLELARVPAVLGGELAATLHAGAALGEARELALSLACVRQVTTGSGRDRSTEERVLWADEATLPIAGAARGPEGLAFLVRFALPADAPQSDPLHAADQVLWRLTARAALPGVDYEAQFELPVFATPESRPERTASALGGERTAPRAGLDPVPGVAVLRHPEGGTELWFARGRHPAQTLLLAAFAAAFGGGAALARSVGAPAPVTFLCAGVAAVVVFVALQLACGRLRVSARADGVAIERRLFGLGRRRWIAAPEIAGVEVDVGMQSGQRVFWDLHLLLRTSERGAGRRHRIGGSLHRKHQAESLAAVLRQALGR